MTFDVAALLRWRPLIGKNVELYPEFQSYFRKHKLPFLAVWGKATSRFEAARWPVRLALGLTRFQQRLQFFYQRLVSFSPCVLIQFPHGHVDGQVHCRQDCGKKDSGRQTGIQPPEHETDDGNHEPDACHKERSRQESPAGTSALCS